MRIINKALNPPTTKETKVGETELILLDNYAIEITQDTIYILRRIVPNDCKHLGPPITRDGVTVKVKCNCNGQETEQWHTAHVCSVHKRCLPSLVPTETWYSRPESKIYHACHGCEEKETCVKP